MQIVKLSGWKLRTQSNQKDRDRNNGAFRPHYCETLKLDKCTLRTKKAEYNSKQLTRSKEPINTNNFWQNWKNQNKSKLEELAIQNGDIWITHFKTLYNTVQIVANAEQRQIHEKLNGLEKAIELLVSNWGVQWMLIVLYSFFLIHPTSHEFGVVLRLFCVCVNLSGVVECFKMCCPYVTILYH